MLYHDYNFKTKEYQDIWNSILENRFESMELYFRKQFSMQRLLSYFKKAFGITPVTIKNSTKNEHKRYRILAIYLLIKYSKEDFKYIAEQFHMALNDVENISLDKKYRLIFEKDIKLFFKQFEEDYILEQKSSLAFRESMLEFLTQV